MFVRSVAVAALAAALSVATAFAADPPAGSSQPPEKERRICRGAQRSLGSHILTPRRCRTEEQWRAEDEAKAPPLALQMTEGQNDGHPPAMPR